MDILRKISKFVNKYMAAIVIAVTVVAYFIDNSFTSWVGNASVLGGNINTTHLLMVVMCGMGMTMQLEDFKIVLSRTKGYYLWGAGSVFDYAAGWLWPELYFQASS